LIPLKNIRDSIQWKRSGCQIAYQWLCPT